MKILLISIICWLVLPDMQAAFAQATPAETGINFPQARNIPAESVAAIVNENVITTFDVRQRMKLMLVSSGQMFPLEALPQLQGQALAELVNEKLKLQETSKFDLVIDERDIRNEIALIATQSGMTYEELLATLRAEGISLKALEDQIRSDLAWPQLVRGRFRNRIRVSDKEIEEALLRMREDISKEQFLVSEICIPVDDPARREQYYREGAELAAQIRNGIPFEVMARQFSACTTAAVGGDLGWVRPGELSPELDRAVRELPAGSVTDPVLSGDAFIIMTVRNRRMAAVPGQPAFSILYTALRETAGDRDTARLRLVPLHSPDSCAGQMLRTSPGPGVGFAFLENITPDRMDPRFRSAVADLKRGESSDVIRADNAYHMIYICNRDDGLGLPSREVLENRIFSRQLARIGQQYLRDIERDSMVEIRLDNAVIATGR